MKKKLIVLAVATVVVVPATALSAEITIGGSLRPSVEFVNGNRDTAGSANVNKNQVSDNASRLRFNVDDKTSGGLKLEASVEVRITTAEGMTGTADTNTFNRRPVWAGIADGWGALRIGTQFDPFDDLSRDGTLMRPLNGHGTLNPVKLLDAIGSSNFSNFPIFRAVQYYTPNVGGVQLRAAMSSNQDKTDVAGTDKSRLSTSVVYSAGPLFVGAGLTNRKSTSAPVNTNIAVGSGVADLNGTRLTGSYKFGSVEVGAAYDKLQTSGFANDVSRDAYEIAVMGTIGDWQPFANFTMANDSSGAAVASGAKDGATFWMVGTRYFFTKATFGFVAYGELKNNAQGRYTLGISNYSLDNFAVGGASNKNDMSALSAGLVYNF